MRDLPRLMGTTKTPLSVAESAECEIDRLIARAEAVLKQLDDEQTARYEQIASLSVQIEQHEAEITRGADLARRLQQVRSVLEAGIEEREP